MSLMIGEGVFSTNYFVPATKETVLYNYAWDRGFVPVGENPDFRFNDRVESWLGGNGLWMRINCNILLKLHLFCIHPAQDFKIGYLANLFKPIASAADLIVNLALLVAKIAYSGWFFFNDRNEDTSLALKNLQEHLGLLYVNLGGLILQPFSLINLLGPKNDVVFRFFGLNHWSHGQGESGSQILDKGKISYLKKRQGWDLSDDFFKTYLPPYWSLRDWQVNREGDRLIFVREVVIEGRGVRVQRCFLDIERQD